tara:strand:+ start:18645 stop:19184 length:540 start_codon:yes stop_codon:yes gene_type:complete
MKLEVRPMLKEEIPDVLDYFLNAPKSYLRKMGVEPTLLPKREEWRDTIWRDMERADEAREFFYLAWIQGGELIGHTNINKIRYEEDAFMHLHVWPEILRRKGMGTKLVKLSLPLYFNKFKLKRLYCEPNALNEPPNKTLVKAGFEFLGTEQKIPGYINFLQQVNKYVIKKEAIRNHLKL